MVIFTFILFSLAFKKGELADKQSHCYTQYTVLISDGPIRAKINLAFAGYTVLAWVTQDSFFSFEYNQEVP